MTDTDRLSRIFDRLRSLAESGCCLYLMEKAASRASAAIYQIRVRCSVAAAREMSESEEYLAEAEHIVRLRKETIQ